MYNSSKDENISMAQCTMENTVFNLKTTDTTLLINSTPETVKEKERQVPARPCTEVHTSAFKSFIRLCGCVPFINCFLG